jgi:hypothetical protein
VLRKTSGNQEAMQQAAYARGCTETTVRLQAKASIPLDWDTQQIAAEAMALRKALAEFEAASGLKIESWNGRMLGEEVALVQALRGTSIESLRRLRQHSKDVTKQIEQEIATAEKIQRLAAAQASAKAADATADQEVEQCAKS